MIVGTFTKLESLVQRHRHVVKLKESVQVSPTNEN